MSALPPVATQPAFGVESGWKREKKPPPMMMTVVVVVLTVDSVVIIPVTPKETHLDPPSSGVPCSMEMSLPAVSPGPGCTVRPRRARP
ncbi:unnamed protein product [Pleuronectes platessa]|uniref:Uncharacterized protein n=1 Tax=Pleuronectes platessa TaxID=8262 RepID=A0A9N7V1A8_PLEPL|nr:unnamed protein product [Pleuronectes platessa]